ncbi:TIGR03943 family putative permease subunit [Actinocrispum wychmicini]|uniref:Putative repeat protein (TIGR03943 family) n=1 Tax=Actinocrispum wychmicini TaxID=1213861 RepID=A0A4R2IYC4_9PSEU|nr:TIGR03943 family protein [Actinocrispum wychmicini]TCO50863.1 putative repeat protein (TIGR03943 family) [Actinocrispum wychmicini]
MRRETQNILLVLLGGALLKISLNGTYLRYVKPTQLPWLIAAGTIMVAVAFISIGRDIIAARRPDGPVDVGHHHGSHSTWLLLLPVLAVFLIAPPALGEDSVNRAAARTPPAPSASSSEDFGFPPLPAGDVIDQRMRDFVERAAWDKSGSLNTRSVRLTGFIAHKGPDTFLARMTISCCAADAYPVKVKLDGPSLDTLAGDQWVQATVRIHPGTANKDTAYVPTATLQNLQLTQQPEDPYEY